WDRFWSSATRAAAGLTPRQLLPFTRRSNVVEMDGRVNLYGKKSRQERAARNCMYGGRMYQLGANRAAEPEPSNDRSNLHCTDGGPRKGAAAGEISVHVVTGRSGSQHGAGVERKPGASAGDDPHGAGLSPACANGEFDLEVRCEPLRGRRCVAGMVFSGRQLRA